MAAATWMEKKVEKFGKEMVESVLTSRGLTDAIKDGTTGLTSGIKGSITKELQNMQASKVSNAAVGNIIEEFGPEKGNKVLSQIKDSGKPIQEAAEEFIQTERQYAGAVGRKDIIPSGQSGSSSKHELMAPEDIEKIRKNEEIFNSPERNVRQKSLEEAFNSEETISKGEFNYNYNSDGSPKTAAERQEYIRQQRSQKEAAQAAKLEKTRSSAKDKLEQRRNERDAENKIKSLNQEARRKEVEDNERSLIKKTFSWVTGNDDGSKWFGGRRTRRKKDPGNGMTWEQLRKQVNQAYIESGQGSYQSKNDFRRNHDAIIDGSFFDTKKGIDFSGIIGWAKENPIKTAGAIAVTGVGAAGLMSRRDGD